MCIRDSLNVYAPGLGRVALALYHPPPFTGTAYILTPLLVFINVHLPLLKFDDNSPFNSTIALSTVWLPKTTLLFFLTPAAALMAFGCSGVEVVGTATGLSVLFILIH